MRREFILVAAAVTFGLAGGYAWSTLTAPPPRLPKPPRATMIAPPPSPEERPEALDRAWAAEADDHAVAANKAENGAGSAN